MSMSPERWDELADLSIVAFGAAAIGFFIIVVAELLFRIL